MLNPLISQNFCEKSAMFVLFRETKYLCGKLENVKWTHSFGLFSKKGQFHRIFCDQKMFQNSFVKSFDFQSSFKNRPLRFSFWFDQVARKLGNASLWIESMHLSNPLPLILWKLSQTSWWRILQLKLFFGNFMKWFHEKSLWPSLFLCFSEKNSR